MSIPPLPEGISEERYREAVERTERLRAILRSPEYIEAATQGRDVRRPSAYTYFILIDGPTLGPVKIGCASDPIARVNQLQTASPYELTLIGYVPGGEELERELHERYAPFRLRGEWFQFEDDQLWEIFNMIWDTPGGVGVMEGMNDD